MKILVTGCHGQVGHALTQHLQGLGEIHAVGREQLDLSRAESIRAVMQSLKPAMVINAAAYTAVDQAESEEALALRINAEAPGILAEEAKKIGASLIHYSTDYVFDGSKQGAWTEDDTVSPLSAYGRSKLLGEQAIAATGVPHLILRTSWVYAAHGSNFAKTMLNLAQERDRLTVIDDQWGAPTGAELLATVTADVLRQIGLTGNEALAGLYHLAASGETTWHAYATHIISEAKVLRPDLPWAVQAIAPVPSSAFVTAALRPHNSRLNTAKLQAAFGINLPDWRQGVDEMLAHVLA